MPIVQINMLKGRSSEQKKDAARAVTNALVDTLGAPRESIRVLIHELELDEFYAGGLTIPERNQALKAEQADNAEAK